MYAWNHHHPTHSSARPRLRGRRWVVVNEAVGIRRIRCPALMGACSHCVCVTYATSATTIATEKTQKRNETNENTKWNKMKLLDTRKDVTFIFGGTQSEDGKRSKWTAMGGGKWWMGDVISCKRRSKSNANDYYTSICCALVLCVAHFSLVVADALVSLECQLI